MCIFIKGMSPLRRPTLVSPFCFCFLWLGWSCLFSPCTPMPRPFGPSPPSVPAFARPKSLLSSSLVSAPVPPTKASLPSAFFPLLLCLLFPLLLVQQGKHLWSHHSTPGTVLTTRGEDKPRHVTRTAPCPCHVALLSLSLLFLPLLPSSSSSLLESSLPAFFRPIQPTLPQALR